MKKALAAVILFAVLVPLAGFAHTNPWNPAALKGPLLTCTSGNCSWGELWHTIAHIITFALALLFYGIAPILFVWGGIKILTSGGSPEGASEGRKIVTGTLVAILIALLSYWLVKFVLETFGVAQRAGF